MKATSRWTGPLWQGAALTALLVGLALVGPTVAPWSPDDRDVQHRLEGPSAQHLLGTDEEGRDTLSRVLTGARLALVVGLGTAALAVGIGLFAGLVAGWTGGWVEAVIMRITDVLMAFPGILLALIVVFVTRDPGVLTVILALSLTSWAAHARLARGLVVTVRQRDFVVAAQLMGASDARIAVRYVMPEILGPMAVQATFAIAGAVMGEASLSFLGLGPQGVVSWGGLLEQGAVLFLKSPALVLSAGGALLLFQAAINLLGDGLRDRLDPRATATTRS